MKNRTINWRKWLFLPPWLVILLSLFCTAALLAVFLRGADEHPVAYGVYVVSAYTLTVLCLLLIHTLPRRYRLAKQKIYEHPLGNRYMTDVVFKARVSLYVSLAINLAYSAMKLTTGIVYRTFWLGALAVYYLLLSLLRFVLLRYMAKENKGLLYEYRRYRLCGILLLILNMSLTGVVLPMVAQNRSFEYPGVMIFAVAAYTFYTVSISIVDLIRYRKYESPVLSASKAIRFAAALVSLLTLETAMLSQFGEDDSFRRLMIMLTGAGVCLIILTVSVYMIARATVEIRKIRNEKDLLF